MGDSRREVPRKGKICSGSPASVSTMGAQWSRTRRVGSGDPQRRRPLRFGSGSFLHSFRFDHGAADLVAEERSDEEGGHFSRFVAGRVRGRGTPLDLEPKSKVVSGHGSPPAALSSSRPNSGKLSSRQAGISALVQLAPQELFPLICRLLVPLLHLPKELSKLGIAALLRIANVLVVRLRTL